MNCNCNNRKECVTCLQYDDCDQKPGDGNGILLSIALSVLVIGVILLMVIK